MPVFNGQTVLVCPDSVGKTEYPKTGFGTAFEKDQRYVIFNFGNQSLRMCNRRSTFSVASFEATCAFQDELILTVTGRRDKKVIQSTNVILRYREVKIFRLNWQNINELEFSPTGGKQLTHCDDTDRHVVLLALTFD